MLLRSLLVSVILGSAACSTTSPKGSSEVVRTAQEGQKPSVQEFDVQTAARLGVEIFEHDRLAWIASDVLVKKVGTEKLQRETPVGWVVEIEGALRYVRFARMGQNGPEAAYDVVFPQTGAPEVVEPSDRSLSASQAARLRAISVAAQTLASGRYPTCGSERMNSVVLRDPGSSGWLVYLLRPKPSVTAVPIGGHYRAFVSEDGNTVAHFDRLSKSCLTLEADQSKEKKTAALMMTHFASSRPLETHVFLSCQENIPFYVLTPDGATWLVDSKGMRVKDGPKY